MRRRRLLFLIAFSLWAKPTLAWHDTGHMVVAAIAWDRMTPKTRQAASDLLGSSFLEAACWADDVKNKTTAPWHYIDQHFRQDGKPDANEPEAKNVVWAIQRFEGELGDGAADPAKRAKALRYLLHFVGDIHQPLHCATLDSDDMPDGDRGGNAFAIRAPRGVEPRPHNLHFLWDEGGGLFPAVRRPLSDEDFALVEKLAGVLISRYGAQASPAARIDDPAVWAREGLQEAQRRVYKGIEPGEVPSQAYLATAQDVCGLRATIAGYRLAALLNRLLG